MVGAESRCHVQKKCPDPSEPKPSARARAVATFSPPSNMLLAYGRRVFAAPEWQAVRGVTRRVLSRQVGSSRRRFGILAIIRVVVVVVEVSSTATGPSSTATAPPATPPGALQRAMARYSWRVCVVSRGAERLRRNRHLSSRSKSLCRDSWRASDRSPPLPTDALPGTKGTTPPWKHVRFLSSPSPLPVRPIFPVPTRQRC